MSLNMKYRWKMPSRYYNCVNDLPLKKKRYIVPHGAHTWEVDVFEGANAGLVVAEIELRSEDEVFERPTWLGEEVSGQRKYSNSALSLFPFKDWI